MLGHHLIEATRDAGMPTTGLDLPEVDITRDADLSDAIPDCDWIVNCAAYTQVDAAESNEQAAYAVNRDGARNLARVCSERDIALLHLSTDYVFDGETSTPYAEDAPTRPVSTYGASKLAGEQEVLAEACRTVIVRTQGLFGTNGKNFVDTILRLLGNEKPLRIVDDQVLCPTYTPHLALAIVALLATDAQGIVHVSASDECSWFSFAQAICQETGSSVPVVPISSDELNLPAKRPPYSVLDASLYESLTNQRIPSWKDGLSQYIARVAKTN